MDSTLNSELKPTLREIVLSQHVPHSQRWHEAQLALAGLESALAALASLGHRLMAVPNQDSAPIVEYPKMMYHDGLGSRVVDSEAEARALGPGWRDTPQVREAQDVPEPEPKADPPPIVEFDPSKIGSDNQ